MSGKDAPHHPPNPGQPAAGLGQVGGPGARPGRGLGVIDQNGGQQLSQIISRGGHRRGRGGVLLQGSPRPTGGAAAGSSSSESVTPRLVCDGRRLATALNNLSPTPYSHAALLPPYRQLFGDD